MIKFSHVYKTYGSALYALRDVSVEIKKGEFVYLTGPSGSGKTTLFNMISALDAPSSGMVEVSQTNVSTLTGSSLPFFRRKVGTVFQDFKLIEDRTVFENISLPLEILGKSKDYILGKVDEVIELVGLQFKVHKLPGSLSGGEKQRVAIARAIVHNPNILIADEPTGNLDPKLSEEIMNVFEQVNAQGTTVMIATHDHALVRRRNKRVMTIKSGRIIEGDYVARY